MAEKGIKVGKELISVPQGIFEMADRLAGNYFATQARHGTMPINKVLGTIYLMGLFHAFNAMEELEEKSNG